jgi:GT2 family glycosyltransferase
MKYVNEGVNALVAQSLDEFVAKCEEIRDNETLRNRLAQEGSDTARRHLNPFDLVDHFFKSPTVRQKWHIVIPHYQARTDYLALAVRSALDSKGPEREVHVFSSSKEKPELPFNDANLHIHHSSSRCSFAQAINKGCNLRSSDATHILLLNDDVIVSKNAFAEMAKAIEGKDFVLNPFSNCDKGWLHNRDIATKSGRPLHPGMSIENLMPELDAIPQIDGFDEDVKVAPFAAMYATLIPVGVWNSVGMLNESYSNGGEDADWCYRARRLGYESYWCPRAFIFHFGGRSRKYSQDEAPHLHEEEDKRNNLLLHKRWNRGNKKRIAIYTGPAWEKWSLNNYREGGTGIGGSEYAAGRLAEAMVDDGHYVMLIGEHETGEQHGVECVNWKEYDPKQEYFDLFIASRNLHCIDDRLKAKRVLVWIHDIWLLSGKEIPKYHQQKVDKFIALSPWHKEFVMNHHNLSSDQIAIIPNGVTKSDFGGMTFADKPREKGRIHFSSSPDRGLDNVLYVLPWLIDACPETKLHVYYGFYNWLSAARSRNNANELKRIDKLQTELDKYKDHVQMHGRVNQYQLRQEWKKASLWMMASDFTETYCISALEAQCSFTPTITTNIAALSSTVGPRGILVKEPPYSAEGRSAYIYYGRKVLSDDAFYEEMAKNAGASLDGLDWKDRYHNYWKPYLD